MRRVHKKNKFHFNKEFFLALKYLKGIDNYIALCFGFFVLFFSFGFIFPFIAPPELLNPILEQIQEIIKDLIEQTEGRGFFGMWWFIFSNNSGVGLISIFFGFLFSIVPAFLLMSNGLVIGLISSFVVQNIGFSSLWMLLPHGIFEIPAIIISFAVGIKFGTFILQKNPRKAFVDYFNNSLRVFIFVVLPLLFVAAIIEAALIVFLG